MKPIRIITCFLVTLSSSLAPAAVRYVPQQYSSIQQAIDACQDLDTVIVAPGRYSGPGNLDISFGSKKIVVRSTDPANPQIINSTIIDCNGKGRGFIFYGAENHDSIVTGLTIINGREFLGGAIYCYNNSSPAITNCVIMNNSATFGGGIVCASNETRPKVVNCQIKANSALVGGGGIYCNSASPSVTNCIISTNFASYGGAIYSHNAGNPVVDNCTIAGNVASKSAGAIYCYKSSNMTLNNTILWSDTAVRASEVLVGNSGAPTSIKVSYCDIQNPGENVVCDSGCTVDWGRGNIDLDPCFAKIGSISATGIRTGSDYHLRSGSPCINAGDPAFVAGSDETDIDGNPRLSGTRVDIGAYEYQAAITATVELKPETLNLASNGKWITCSITLPDGYDVGDIDVASIRLDGAIFPAWSIMDRPAQKLLVKFDRSQTQQMLEDEEGPVSLNVSGSLNGGTGFGGSDSIRVLHTHH
jgi:predicted outer membrane repeat protein